MAHAKLSEVFGIGAEVPTYTYVDRSNLDSKFKYLLDTQRHLVLFGASKQGKTVLRKKGLPERDSIVVQCHSETSRGRVYLEILRQLQVDIPSERIKRFEKSMSVEGSGTVDTGVPLLGKVGGTVKGQTAETSEDGGRARVVSIEGSDLAFVSDAIGKSKKRIVIEDFHYLTEEEKKALALDLKAFWDLKVFFLIVGVWAEHNLLTYYNGDLAGRVEEVNVAWHQGDLLKVLSRGCEALNIGFEEQFQRDSISDANGNVGLLQRLLEKFCYESGIFETQDTYVTLKDPDALDRARRAICSEEAVRYQQFAEAVSKGFKSTDETALKVYEKILKVCLTATDADLLKGIDRDEVLRRINGTSGGEGVRLSDLSQALNKLNRLQEDRKVAPLIVFYDSTARKIQLVDRELLFYRKYGNPKWPWV